MLSAIMWDLQENWIFQSIEGIHEGQTVPGVIHFGKNSATPPPPGPAGFDLARPRPPARGEAMAGSLGARCTILPVAKSPGALVREFCRKHRICTHCFHRRALRGVTRCEPCKNRDRVAQRVIAIAKGLRTHGKFLVAHCENELSEMEP